ncbi:hypothetical protein LOTGIDRAFT_168829 [Lottia gigantea]|uniref:DAGKc domain-containing protein n=1 Tax=Lottia gigantea TaxID=225164 RepID=V3ZPI4_LOTGI|nr:hypothetical protein LOTGIDRAFT_168829 [Lottia gigantea]ESO84380.1 hypothetical protein LOTGIDRAFT_168829 [Lottia gigantea]
MAAVLPDDVLLQTSLEIDHKPYVVTLTRSQLVLEASESAPVSEGSNYEAFIRVKTDMIDLNEVIGVRVEHPASSKDKTLNKDVNTYTALEMLPLQLNVFTVYYIIKSNKHRWRYKALNITCRDHNTSQLWVESIRKTIHNICPNRPKRLLVFINPIGGKKKGPKIYSEKVGPLFEIAGIYTEVIVTKRQFHARDVLRECDLSKYDGIISVGGDGTFSEILNGLLDRTMRDCGIAQTPHSDPVSPKIPVGIIPAGSTDSIVYTTIGISDPVTSALNIIFGNKLGLDVSAVHQRGEFLKYSVSFLGYGYYGDLVADSERLRWMGPKRYNWSGFKKFLSKNTYEGEVSFISSTDTSHHPRDGNKCLKDCSICKRARENKNQSTGKSISAQISKPTENWQKVRGRFICINAHTMSCRCALSPEGASPSSHIGDGHADLILISNCSRVNYFRHLYRSSDRTSDQFDFNFIQVFRVKEFRFDPLPEHDDDADEQTMTKIKEGRSQLRPATIRNSVWNCDGEILDHPNLHVKVHCQLIQLFAGGIEEIGKEEVFQCPPCCSRKDDR